MEPAQESTFEDDLSALERVVDELERGDGALAAALARYEHGVTLLVRCQAALERAERSVALLTGVNTDGAPLTAPFDASATASTPAPVPAPAPDTAPPAPRKRTPRARPAADSRDDDSIPF